MTDLPDDFQTASLAEVDPAIAEVLRRELHRQQSTLEMIASENFVPQAVLEATGSVLTNKYAEGYPGRRYYGGCEEVDVAEQLAIDRAKELFGAEHVNVQPHAGAQANNAAYMAMLEPGDTIMGMALDHGGHLTHGMRLNVSGKLYEVVAYHVRREDLLCDMEEVERLYAEGYPGRRYYGGCEEVDVAEQLAIDRAKELFGAEHANVQPHAGAQANNAAYMAMLEPGDTIMGMALDHGGHLTHGMKLNVSGKLYEVVAYHVRREDLPVRHGGGRAARRTSTGRR